MKLIRRFIGGCFSINSSLFQVHRALKKFFRYHLQTIMFNFSNKIIKTKIYFVPRLDVLARNKSRKLTDWE